MPRITCSVSRQMNDQKNERMAINGGGATASDSNRQFDLLAIFPSVLGWGVAREVNCLNLAQKGGRCQAKLDLGADAELR